MDTKKLQTGISIIIPLASAALLGLAVLFESYFFHFVVLALIISDVLFYLYFPQGTELKRIVSVASIPFFLLLVTAGGLFFSNNAFLSVTLISAFSVLQLLYLLPDLKSVASHIRILICFYVFFAVSIIFFALLYFLDIPFWYVIAGVLITVVAVQESALSLITNDRVVRLLIEAITCVLVTEVLYALTWLPLEYIPSSAVASILYFFYFDGITMHLQAQNTRVRMLYSGILMFGVLVCILLLVRWR